MPKLIDGTDADSNSEAWRHECEARAIYAMPTLDERRARLETIERKRGKASADALRATMTKLWKAKK